MFDLKIDEPQGVLRSGWFAQVGDYAIDGGWILDGHALVVGDAAGSIYAFDGQSGATLWVQQEVHKGGVLAVAVHPNKPMFASAGQDGRVLVWDINEGLVNSISTGRDSDWVENIEWSPQGQLLAASISRQVRMYDLEGTEIWRSDNHPSTVSSIRWSDTEELATACYGRVTFFDGANGALLQKLEWKGSLISMELSPDGDIVACGSQDNTIHFWRRSTGDDSMMAGYPAKPSSLAFNDTGQLLAAAGGEAVTVWDFRGDGPEDTEPGILEVHRESVTSLTFALGSNRLASGGRDGRVIVWSIQENGKGRLAGAALVADVVAQLYWRLDGCALAAFDGRGGVTTWRVKT